MSVRRLFQASALFLTVGIAVATNAGNASACDASGWLVMSEPVLPCVRFEQRGENGFLVHNECADAVELTPVECQAPCEEALRIAPGSEGFLELAAPESDTVHHAFDYKHTDQSGELDFLYQHNPCPSEGGCSAASIRSQPGSIATSAILLVCALFGLRRARP